MIAVMLAHFSWTARIHFPDLGSAAVRLFFVLSGFLITGILLQCRERVAAGTTTAGFQLRQFYGRRVLRIFPAFYAVLLASVALHIGTSWQLHVWHAFYAGNLYLAAHGSWIDLTAHLWSLAVEEQFYLIWPYAVLFLPRKKLPWLIAALIATGLFSRLALVVLVPANPVAYIAATPACADQLGVGALLAWCWHMRLHERPWFRRWHSLAMLLLVLVPVLVRWPDHPAIRVLSPLVQSLAFAALVHRAALGFDGVLGSILSWAPLLWVGKISYGLYLVHNFAHWWGPRVLRQLTQYRIAYLPTETGHVLYLMALSFIGATLSWYLLERPILRLKARFNYAS